MSEPTLPLRAAILPVTPFQQNCALLWAPQTMHGVVVDPGGDVDNILRAVAEMEVVLDRILLTHGHIDHAGGAAELAERAGVEIVGPHRDDEWLLARLPESGAQYGIPARPVQPDRWLEEGDSVEIGDRTFEVLHCPGHTPGHIVFVNRALNFGLFGDVLFRGSVGRSDIPRGNHDQLVNSIRSGLWPLGNDIQFVPGHGQPSTFGWERKTNPYVADLLFDD
jgi:glyoxylase-like metal-dependent hydrolase (beta-lactamase superfamily II)